MERGAGVLDMTTRIIGTGSSLPRQTVTNEDLSKIMDTSDEWISSRTGIRERHLAKEETTASLSVEAAGKALQNAGVLAEEVDLLIVATITGDYVTPSTACEVQAGLGASRAVAFDINAACSGYGPRIPADGDLPDGVGGRSGNVVQDYGLE